MKQLIQMFLFDVKMNTKSFMGGYMLIVPVIILIVLRTFLPSVESANVTIAAVTEGPNAVEERIIEALDELFEILPYSSIEEVERKLDGIGHVEGLYREASTGQYVSILERAREDNKVFSFAARVIRQLYFREHYPEAPRLTEYTYGVPPELSERTKISPVATMGGSIFLVFMIVINAFIIGLGVVNDKEYGTDKALKVTPVNKADYYIGKCILPMLITLVYTLIALLVLGLIHVNILQVYVVTIVSFAVTLFLGLLMGAIGRNEVEAIGVGKMIGMLMGLAILGSTLLPENWRWAVWWTPFYWLYDILEEIFTETATWAGLGWKSAVVIGLSGLYFLLFRKKIIKGLS